MNKYEIGTQRFRIMKTCFMCAKRLADELIVEGKKVYIRDINKNKIIYGNYFGIGD